MESPGISLHFKLLSFAETKKYYFLENVRTQRLGHWADRENRRQFLLDFAKKMGFDPFIEENWQYLTPKIAANQVVIS